MPSRIEASVQVSAPVALTYRRGTRFESFPQFLPGIVAVHVLEGECLRFDVMVAGTSHRWEAHVAERVRNRRLILRAEDPVPVTGVFEFEPQRRGLTELRAEVSYDVDPLRARLLELLVDPRRQLEDGLRRFAESVEAEHANTNANSNSNSNGQARTRRAGAATRRG